MINPEMGLRLVFNITGSDGEDAVITMDSPEKEQIPFREKFHLLEDEEISIHKLILNSRIG